MATLLYVKSSIFGDQGQSNQLAQALIEDWKSKNPSGEVVVRDLTDDVVPHLDGERFGAFLTPEEARSDAQKAMVEFSDKLIDEVRQADILVVGVPMYNFGVPSQLKAWFDQLARAGVTFKYTETGAQGLLDNKPVVLLATRGGMYKDAGVDFQIPYVQQFFAFIGLSDSRVIYAEGLAMGDELRDRNLASARQELSAHVN